MDMIMILVSYSDPVNSQHPVANNKQDNQRTYEGVYSVMPLLSRFFVWK